ncbi:hypothetical protein ES703_119194 [subsurface metagenome]
MILESVQVHWNQLAVGTLSVIPAAIGMWSTENPQKSGWPDRQTDQPGARSSCSVMRVRFTESSVTPATKRIILPRRQSILIPPETPSIWSGWMIPTVKFTTQNVLILRTGINPVGGPKPMEGPLPGMNKLVTLGQIIATTPPLPWIGTIIRTLLGPKGPFPPPRR